MGSQSNAKKARRFARLVSKTTLGTTSNASTVVVDPNGARAVPPEIPYVCSVASRPDLSTCELREADRDRRTQHSAKRLEALLTLARFLHHDGKDPRGLIRYREDQERFDAAKRAEHPAPSDIYREATRTVQRFHRAQRAARKQRRGWA